MVDGNWDTVLLEAGAQTIRSNSKTLPWIALLVARMAGFPLDIPALRSALTLPHGRLILGSVLSKPFAPANMPQPTTTTTRRAAVASFGVCLS